MLLLFDLHELYLRIHHWLHCGSVTATGIIGGNHDKNIDAKSTIVCMDGQGCAGMGKDGQGWARMGRDGQGWAGMDRDGQRYAEMGRDGQGYAGMGRDEQRWAGIQHVY